MNNGYFDIKRDIEVINKGGFFCQACLVSKTGDEMSKRDTRYCLKCQPFIEEDYQLRGQRYIPLPPEANLAPNNTQPIQTHTKEVKTKLATLNDPSPTVANFRPRGRPKSYEKCSLPNKRIKQLHNKGMGSKAIASKLRTEGVDVSYRTIHRILSGERN